jgi:hypothetical protein
MSSDVPEEAAAVIRGVIPTRFIVFTAAPFSKSRKATDSNLYAIANDKREVPSESTMLISASS